MSARGGLRRRLPAEIWAEPRRFVEEVLGPISAVERDPDGVYVAVGRLGGRIRLEPDLAYLPRLRAELNGLGRLQGQPLPLATGSWLLAAARRLHWQDRAKGPPK